MEEEEQETTKEDPPAAVVQQETTTKEEDAPPATAADAATAVVEYTMDDCNGHADADDFWAVVDSYVLDLSAFVRHHPGTLKRLVQKRHELGHCDLSPHFLDHFKHTVTTFRTACQEYDQKQQPVHFSFRETKDLKKDVQVTIIGKVKK